VTFSICVREPYTVEVDADSDPESEPDVEEHVRYGVAVTTRLPAVGTLCPFASENGAVATQSLVNVRLGRKGVEYLDDGLAVEDALQALLNADDEASQRQLHGVDADGEFAFSGEECQGWYGHRVGDNYTVAGNLLTGEAVVEAVAETYEAGWSDVADPADPERPLAERLVDALAAGHAEGGDKREELHVQSAALLVERTEERAMEPYYEDLRVDATETPIADLRETYEYAGEGFEMAVERYEEAYEEDDMEAADEAATDDADDGG
jgi:uncharacterized Ntn-hydrolase superfamily protein